MEPSRHVDLLSLLQMALDKGASDLHLAVPNHPVLRIRGALWPLQDFPRLTPQHMEALFTSITDDAERGAFGRNRELDFSYGVSGLARFRVNASLQRGSVALSFRAVPHQPPMLEELGLPETCRELASRPRGLVLVTGPTGSGKSTTLAAMVHYINANFSRRIITMEDPIEFLHSNQKSMILQREVGSDTLSFAAGLKHVLRQDPNVIMVGELRDPETISIALTAAETGHLVLSTLHTNGAAQAVERIVETYPGNQQQQVRMQLSMVLEGILFQLLLPRSDGAGRVAAVEVLVGTPAVRNLIRSGEMAQMATFIQMGAKFGMQSLDQSLASLVNRGLVKQEEARAYVRDANQFQQALAARPAPGNS